MTHKHYAIIGGGINGLSVARQLMLESSNIKLTVFEKEHAVAQHQSSHNSGVVHAGLYYEPKSLKANLCRRGVALIKDYCKSHHLPYDECGKLVVALKPEEIPRLENIYKKSLANDVTGVRLIDFNEMQSIEPNCVGIKAIHSPQTAIVSYERIAVNVAEELKAANHQIVLNAHVAKLIEGKQRIKIQFVDGTFFDQEFDRVISCTGLQSDRLAHNSGDTSTPKIIPFFGQYYVIDSAYKDHVKGLIYPVPDPKFPFLGVHFTKRIDGQMTIGPNAFISMGRENYNGRNYKIADIMNFLMYPGFWKFVCRNIPAAIRELKTVVSPSCFLQEAAKYVPSLAKVGITKATRGIRAQAMHADGILVDDFVIRHQGKITYIRNAPSPGATSSLAIAEHIVQQFFY